MTTHVETAELVVSIADAVRDLIEPKWHFETYAVREGNRWVTKRHGSTHPSLLDQLRAAEPTSGEGGSSGSYESRPAARLEAMDVLADIEHQASSWVSHRNELRGTIEGNLRAIVGIATALEQNDLADLAREVRRWRTWARVVTGWDSVPWRPDVACPNCERRGGLRIRLTDHSGVCLDCRETWDPDTIGLLADHIRFVTGGEGDRGDRDAASTWRTA